MVAVAIRLILSLSHISRLISGVNKCEVVRSGVSLRVSNSPFLDKCMKVSYC